MTIAYILSLAQGAILVTLQLIGPILLVSLVLGVVLSIVQSATQISEVTLTFVPKIIVVGAIILLLGPWMLQVFIRYTIALFESLPNLVH
jgi:flagellar biosynthesis protein FliQ